jgi:hypothetical protein
MIKVVIIFCVTVMFLEQTGSYANPVLDIIFEVHTTMAGFTIQWHHKDHEKH